MKLRLNLSFFIALTILILAAAWLASGQLGSKEDNLTNLNVNIENKSNKSLTRNESFPAVSLSVKNPVSSKVLTLLVTLQVLSNIGILYFLYIGME